MKEIPLTQVEEVIDRFVLWLERYGETSWDHQTYFAGPVGRRAKALYYRNKALGTMAVAPMILSEALAPSARRLFSERLRFPIADAHYAMGFAFKARAHEDSEAHARASSFLVELERSRCSGYQEWCWGYPFDWETRNGTIRQGTPLITSTPYAYEAFREVHRIDGDSRWLAAMASMARHATTDIQDYPHSDKSSTCSYTPFDKGGVVNASAYRACMLAWASSDFNEDRYWNVAERNLNFVLETQRPDGAWPYSVDGERDFVDHFHTCFVLKALAKIDRIRPSESCRQAINKGVDYYLGNLLDEKKLPKPFSKAPRMTVYRRELYDYAECINLCVLLRDRIGELGTVLDHVIADVLARWIKPDGSFRSRELWFSWDNVPMHRWAQSQMFRSLSLLALNERESQAANRVA
jgi:hypothetical protein